MMRNFLILFFVLFAAFPAISQSSPTLTKEEAAVVDAAQKAVLQAVNFSQGDAEALKSARRNFTPEGWDDFMKHMTGFVDKNGAPAFSSNFEPSGNAVVIGHENGTIHFKVPGTLTQTQGKLSKTTYKNAAIDVKATGNPPKISHLEQITPSTNLFEGSPSLCARCFRRSTTSFELYVRSDRQQHLYELSVKPSVRA